MPRSRSVFDTFDSPSSDARAERDSDEATATFTMDESLTVLPNLLMRTQLYEAVLGRIASGVCIFNSDWKLELGNERYAVIFGLDATALSQCASLAALLAKAPALEHATPGTADDYLAWCHALCAEDGERVRDIGLGNGLTYRASHWPLANGAFLVTLDDVTAEIANAELANERLSLQTLIDTVPDYLWVKGADSRFLIANKALAKDWGLEPAEIVGLSDRDFHPPERAEVFQKAERTIVETNRPMIDRQEFVVDDSGNEKWFSSTKMPLVDEAGSVFGIVGISRDITELKREVIFREGQAKVLEMIAMSAPLHEVLESLVLLVEAQLSGVSGSVLLLSRDGKRLRNGASPHLDPAYTALIEDLPIGPEVGSCGAAAFLARQIIVSDIQNDPLWKDGQDLARAYGYRSCWSTPVISHEKVLGTFALYSPTVRAPTAHEMAIIELATRIAGIAIERQRAEERIRYMASHDALTGLANRSMLDDLLALAIDGARRQGRRVLVLFVDLDNFKSVNDNLGHTIGDELLKEVAARLTQCMDEGDSVVRLGGDEFVTLLAGRPMNPGNDVEAIEQILGSIAAPVVLADHRLRVSCSIGVAAFPEDGDTPETLLTKADVAMYKSKQGGKDKFTIYDPNLKPH